MKYTPPPSKLRFALIFLSLVAPVLAGCATEAKKTDTQPTQAKAEPQKQQPQAPAPIIDKYALDRLKQMADHLKSADSFMFHADSFIEFPAVTGQFITGLVESDVAVQRPNKLRADIAGDVPVFHVYFDGEKVATFDPKNKLHAVSERLSSIDEMLEYLNKNQINFPSADFLYSDPYSVMTKNVTQAIVVGESVVDGVPCEHLAFMEPGINWEIWIEKGKNPLPLRIAMVYTQAQHLAHFTAEYKGWSINPKLKPEIFDFKPPSDSRETEFSGKLKTQTK